MQNDDTTRHNNLIQPADAIEMLKADHRRVRALFRRYDETDDQAMKQGIMAELFVELELHTQLEETVFYPAFADETNREGQELVEASLEAHEDVDVLVGTSGPRCRSRGVRGEVPRAAHQGGTACAGRRESDVSAG